MSRQHWLIKSEPSKYSFATLVRDGRTIWDGVRNFEARNFMRAMKAGDLALFYHSNEGKSIVGVARIAREAYADPTAEGEDWSAIDLEPVAPFKLPVSLDTIRSDPSLFDIALLKRSRLSVVPVTPAHFDRILELGKTKLSQRRRAAKAPASPPRASRA
jgi:predicted RNA-binding protein with PUA-like domain